jgi:hypothetical protein
MTDTKWKPGPPTEPGLWWVNEGDRIVMAVVRHRMDITPETVRCWVYPGADEVMSIRGIALYGRDHSDAMHAPAEPPS